MFCALLAHGVYFWPVWIANAFLDIRYFVNYTDGALVGASSRSC
jgi:hypothetical protein